MQEAAPRRRASTCAQQGDDARLVDRAHVDDGRRRDRRAAAARRDRSSGRRRCVTLCGSTRPRQPPRKRRRIPARRRAAPAACRGGCREGEMPGVLKSACASTHSTMQVLAGRRAMPGDAGDRAHRQAVVAAEKHRQAASVEAGGSAAAGFGGEREDFGLPASGEPPMIGSTRLAPDGDRADRRGRSRRGRVPPASRSGPRCARPPVPCPCRASRRRRPWRCRRDRWRGGQSRTSANLLGLSCRRIAGADVDG